MVIKEVLDKTTQFFKDKKLESPRLDAEILLGWGLGLSRIELYLKFDRPLSEQELSSCRELVRRRALGEPVAYILGSKDFFGTSFTVNSNVLIPRPETELLVEKILEWAKSKNAIEPNSEKSFSILDLGTGSGCIGLSLLRNLPKAKAILLDKSEQALQVAKENAKKLELETRAEFILGDASHFQFNRHFDIIVANPPYIAATDPDVQENVKKFEPNMALFSEDQGLYDIRAWIQNAVKLLNKPGVVGFEFGSTQGPAVKKIFQELNLFDEININKDLSGLDRFIIAQSNG